MTSYSVDLHIHTHYSDGKYSPRQQLEEAARQGVKVVAFTDHDNANGYRQGLQAALELGIELVPAVELTTSWPSLDTLPGSADVDLLGYFINVDTPAFQALEREARLDLCLRLEVCCSRLTHDGFPLRLEEILAVNRRFPSLTSVVLALREKGYAAEWGDALRLLTRHWHQVRPSRLEISQAIHAIHAAGGVAVLAHPAAIECRGQAERGRSRGSYLPPGRLEQLAEMGLDGIEIYHHRNDELARDYFLNLARRHNLLVSGGSDDHGWRVRHLGSQPVTSEMLEALRQRARPVA